MLSRTIRRALRETGPALPPTFLLPWTAGLSTTTSAAIDPTPPPPPLVSSKQTRLEQQTPSVELPICTNANSSSPEPHDTLKLSQQMRELLPLLQSQGPHYITAHIHGFPYLVTQGDTVRLPFHMHGVEPGDVLRLDRAVNLGSRDYTLKAPAPAAKLKSPTKSTYSTLDPTTGSLASYSRTMPADSTTEAPEGVPHFIPHIAKGKFSYIDDRLFECRAVVMGVESEPLRIKEKTKRRQRHVRKVKSKHRFTILRIKEVRIKSIEEIEGRQ
ncbi:Homocitrate dehydratase [Cercospora zeina]